MQKQFSSIIWTATAKFCLPDVLYMGKISFSYVQKCIKNKVGVCPSGRKE